MTELSTADLAEPVVDEEPCEDCGQLLCVCEDEDHTFSSEPF
jgi:hypothetical protein